MFRRHPVIAVVAVVYFGSLCVLLLGPMAGAKSTFVGSMLAFAPTGILLVVLFGRHRWLSALSVGALAVVWVELACIVWRPDAPSVPLDLVASLAGVTVGVLVGLAITARRAPDRSTEIPSFTRLSQTGGSGWSPERPQD